MGTQCERSRLAISGSVRIAAGSRLSRAATARAECRRGRSCRRVQRVRPRREHGRPRGARRYVTAAGEWSCVRPPEGCEQAREPARGAAGGHAASVLRISGGAGGARGAPVAPAGPAARQSRPDRADVRTPAPVAARTRRSTLGSPRRPPPRSRPMPAS